MNDLIQVIKVLESDEVKKLNEFIDTLEFKQNTLIGSSDFIDDKMRGSTGSFLDDNHELIINFHNKINQGLDEYKRRLINIHENFQDEYLFFPFQEIFTLTDDSGKSSPKHL